MAAGLLLRFYAAPRLIAAPADLYQTDTLVAADASYFDEGSLTTRHGVTLTYTLTIRGDPGASTSTTAVWDSFADLADLKRGVQVNSTYQRAVFNRRTGQLLDCCGAAVNDDTRVRQDGIGLFWPIGVRKATYQVFDVNAESAWPATYSGTADVQGVMTYRFVQHIPPTLVAQMAGVPSSLLGLRGKVSNVVADRYYQADNTFWVDPRTGVDHRHRAADPVRAARPGGQGQLMVADSGPEDVRLKPTPAGRPGQQERCLDRHAAGDRPPRLRHRWPYPHPGGHDPVPPSRGPGKQRGLAVARPTTDRSPSTRYL